MKKKKKRIAEVAIGVPVPGPFHYLVPSHLANDLKVGKRVWVPFRNRLKVGYVVGFVKKPGVPKLRRIREVIDPTPILSREILELTRWVADYYHSSWGEAIEASLPRPLKQGRTRVGRKMRQGVEEVPPKSPELGARLHQDFGGLPTAALAKVGATFQGIEGLDSIFECLDSSRFEVFLSFGSSTQRVGLYLQAMARTLRLGRSCILLVPEISLIPRTIDRLRPLLCETIAIFHSGLSAGERFFQWQRAKDGRARVVVGARSAVFAPVKDLGLIVVDEEHEAAYKQDDAPRYNARDVALARGRQNEACLILGSQTPSLESYYNASKRRYKLIKLSEAPWKRGAELTLPSGKEEARTLPYVRIIDMREEPKEAKKRRIFSRALEEGLRDRLAKGERIVLFLNRRGFATFISCRSCGFVKRCEACRVSLTYHFYRKELICHYCNSHQALSEICPECKSKYLRYFGLGTQKVESEVSRLFPEANVARIDLDTAHRKGSYQDILTDFKRRKIDILVGTQLIAKVAEPLDVGLVGVISADLLLNLPDFRSSERSFQLLVQLEERVGTKGEIIIQTYSPNHHSILAARDHDFKSFFKEEIRSRRELGYPPYSHLINLILRGKKKEKVIGVAKALAKNLRKKKPKNVTLVGPAPLPIPKLRGSFRWHLILKGKEVGPMNKHLRKVLINFKISGGVRLTVDVDPMTML